MSGSVGEYARTVRYDDEFLNEFIERFADSSESYKTALSRISDKSSPYFVGESLLGSLYLMLFCRKVASDFLLNEALTDDEIKSFVGAFTRDLEGKTLRISAKTGVRGIVATEEILTQNQYVDAVIRPPKLDDLPSEVAVPDRWEGKMDVRNYPHIPAFCSVIEVFPREFTVDMGLGGLVMMPKMFDSNLLFDRFIGAVYPELTKLTWLLMLFQSEHAPQFRSASMCFYLKYLSVAPVYEKSIPVSENQYEIQPFALTSDNKGSLMMFWERMIGSDFIERIFGKREASVSVIQHRPKPLEIAIKRYIHILSEFEESKVRIHDALEAIEGFFTPEDASSPKDFAKYRKIFIRRVTALIGLFKDLDPNDTNWALRMGFKIRSDYSHRASGWEEGDQPVEEDEVEARRKASEREFQNGLSELLLNYLRICIVARILAGGTDREFIRLLDSRPYELKRLLAGLDHLVESDPLIYVDRDLVRCVVCRKDTPWRYFSQHIEREHQDELKERYGTSDFDATISHAYDLLTEAISKSFSGKTEVTTQELHAALVSIDSSFDPQNYFVADLDSFVSLLPRQLNRKKRKTFGVEFVYKLPARSNTSA